MLTVLQTKFLFDLYPNARSVQVKKEGFLGIMVIYGKHVEVGNGIFISDLREESNAVTVRYCLVLFFSQLNH